MPWFDRSEIRLYTIGFCATLIVMPIILAALAAAAARVDIAEVWRCALKKYLVTLDVTLHLIVITVHV
jgi:hypothetical protein